VVLELFNVFFDYLILLIIVLVRVAFVTLLEQKVLAGTQIRIGPNYVGYWGILQPFADAVKLFNKEGLVLRNSNYLIYFLRPVVSLGLRLFLWGCVPQSKRGCDVRLGVMFFMVVRGVGVFPILLRG
jgi:NADH-ubiquinone oxidoreductase chain 1